MLSNSTKWLIAAVGSSLVALSVFCYAISEIINTILEELYYFGKGVVSTDNAYTVSMIAVVLLIIAVVIDLIAKEKWKEGH